MTVYADLKRSVAARTVASVAVLWAVRPVPAVFAPAAGLVVAAGNARATALSDLALAEWLDATPLGLTPPVGDVERLTGAFATILDTTGPDDDPVGRLDRLATAEPLAAAQSSWSEGLRGHGVDGWTRVTGGEPCPVCEDLADGSTFPPSVDMVVPHPTCCCVAEPVTGD